MLPRARSLDDELDEDDVRAKHEALQLGEAVLVDLLRELYGNVEAREKAVRSEWEDAKDLLEQKKWTMEQQLLILEKEVSGLHTKLADVEKQFKERSGKVQAAYRKVLHSFYLLNNPEKLKSLDGLLNHFRDREHEILDKIKERYGLEVDAVPLIEAGVLPEGGGQDSELSRLNSVRDQVWEDVAGIEELVKRSNEEFERVKRELYFPRADGWRFKHGFEGVYVAMNDFWLEALSARLSISVMDRVATPGILVTAAGSRAPGSEQVRKIVSRYTNASSSASTTGANPIRGGVVSFRLDKCGLYGEKGTKVPTMRPDQIQILVEFTLTVPVQFSSHANAWKASSGFQFKILRIERKIKGSLYVPKSLLRMILNRVLPSVIKTAIVDAIPVELGHYLSTQYDTLGKADIGLNRPRARPLEKSEPMHLDLDVNLIGGTGDLSALDANMSLASPEQPTSSNSSGQGNGLNSRSKVGAAPVNSNRWATTGGAAPPPHHIHAAKRVRQMFNMTLGQAKTFVALQYEVDKVFRNRMHQVPVVGAVGGSPRHANSQGSLSGSSTRSGTRGLFQTSSTAFKESSWPGPLITATDMVQFFMRFSNASFAAHQWKEHQAHVACAEDAGTPPLETWESILSVWQQLADKYASFYDTERISIFKIFDQVRKLTLKPIRTHIELSNVRLRGSVDATILMSRRIMERQMRELYKESQKRRVHLTKSLDRCLKDIGLWFREAMEPIKYIKQSLHVVSLGVHGRGVAGDFEFSGDDVAFQGPVRFIMPFEPSVYLPTHFVIRTSINEDQGAFNIALALAPFIDPDEVTEGNVLELALTRLFAGVYFDVNAYLSAKMIEFKSLELSSQGNVNPSSDIEESGQIALQGKQPPVQHASLADFLKPSRPTSAVSAPSMAPTVESSSMAPTVNKEIEDTTSIASEVDSDSRLSGDDATATTNSQAVDFDVDVDGVTAEAPDLEIPQPSETPTSTMPPSPRLSTTNRRSSDASTSTIFDNMSDVDDAESDSTGDGGKAHGRRSSAAATAWNETTLGLNKNDLDDRNGRDAEREDDIDEEEDDPFVDDDFDPTTFEMKALREFELSLKNGQRTLDDQLIGAKTSTEDTEKTNRAYAESSLAEGSMDRFLHHFMSQLALRGELQQQDWLSILQGKFQHDSGSNFMFRVDTHELCVMKAGAEHVEVSGNIRGIAAYVHGWIRYMKELAAKDAAAEAAAALKSHPYAASSAQSSLTDHAKQAAAKGPAAETPPEEAFTGLAKFAEMLVKYVDNPEVKYSISFQLYGGVRNGQLIGTLVQGSSTRSNLPRSFAAATVIEAPVNLLELFADIVNITRMSYGSEDVEPELGYFW